MPSYVLEDEAFWFSNIEAISANQFHRRSFPGLATDSFRCFLDLTVGGNHLNLRQALLLYDEVWCSPPLAECEEDFLRRQELQLGDLLQVVESGRLRFVTTQPEERLNCRFLSEVNERRPDAILGRRTTAALLLSDSFGTIDEPPLFHALKSVVSKHLNFHCCFNLSLAESWMDNETRDVNRDALVPAVPLLEFEAAIPIGEILEDTAQRSTRAKGRGLYARLIELAPEERQAEIDQLSFALRASTRTSKSIVLDVVNIGTLVAGLFGVPFPPVFGLGTVGRPTLERLRRIRVVDDMILRLEEKIRRSSRKQEIDFLSRINRVATFWRCDAPGRYRNEHACRTARAVEPRSGVSRGV